MENIIENNQYNIDHICTRLQCDLGRSKKIAMRMLANSGQLLLSTVLMNLSSAGQGKIMNSGTGPKRAKSVPMAICHSFIYGTQLNPINTIQAATAVIQGTFSNSACQFPARKE